MAGERAAGDPIPDDCKLIEVHVAELRQLFNAIDPSPFRERDLDPQRRGVHRRLGARAARDAPAGARSCHLDRPPARPRGGRTCAMPSTSSSRSARRHAPRLRDLFRARPDEPGDRPARSSRRRSMSATLARSVLRRRAPSAQFLAGEPAHRRLGGDVAAARDLPLRLVADPGRSAALRPVERHAGPARLLGRGRL